VLIELYFVMMLCEILHYAPVIIAQHGVKAN